MPMNPAVQAVIKAITRLQPDVANSWNSQRKVEDAAGKLTIADPRCRIDEITATADDGYEIPLRVFTPLDIDFSLKRGLHVNEDHRGTILYLHGGGWANGDVEFYSDACMRTALKLERRVIAVDYRRSPSTASPPRLRTAMPWRGSCSLARLSATPIPSASCSWATRPAATSQRP